MDRRGKILILLVVAGIAAEGEEFAGGEIVAEWRDPSPERRGSKCENVAGIVPCDDAVND